MTDWTWEENYHYEISYSRSQAYTHERYWHECIGDPTLTVGQTGFTRPILESPSARGWDKYKITGTVYDVNGDPVVGADVYLFRGDQKGLSIIQHVQSNASGVYLFYLEDKETDYSVVAWFYDSDLAEYIRGVTDRDLNAVAS